MSEIFKFGEDVEGYEIPVVNEREVRASAGILFLGLFISVVMASMKADFLVIKYFVMFFLTDFLIRVFINPRFSPTLIIGRMIVRNQVPEYVGAKQKKFAWVIGLVLAASMFVLMAVMNTYSPITGITCMICLILLFFESAFGICIGCKFYKMFYKEKAQYCPGEACMVKTKQEIQKTNGVQLMIVFGFIVYFFLAVYFLNSNFSKKPHNLFGTEELIAPEK